MKISKKVFSLLLAALMAVSFAACSSAAVPSADLVVYGKVFTSEGSQIVEAFAVKDGKYIYVGDRKGAEAFVDSGKTEVVDYTGKGLVMPGCGNGHAHYMLGYALKTVGTTINYDDTPDNFLAKTVPAAAQRTKEQRLFLVRAGISCASRIICLLVSSWTQYAVIFPCTSWMMNATRLW